MGGRLLAFRWMMEAPVKNLSKATLAQRAALHARFPAYKPLSDQATQIQNELRKMPLKPAEKTDELQKQTDLFVKLQQVSLAQESMLASVALRRQPADMNFPPPVDVSELAERVGEEEIALVMVGTSSTTYMFGVSRKGASLLAGFPTKRLANSISRLNRELQILAKQVDLDDLGKEDKWKKASSDLADVLFNNIKPEDWGKLKKLVIVPDGVTWYLPWEVLRVGADEQNKKMLVESLEFRYSPTLGLAFQNKLPFHRITRSAAFADRLHSKSEEEQSKLAAEALLVDLPKLTIFDKRVMIPSGLLGVAADQFIVFSAIERQRGGILATYGISPIQLDSDRKAGNTLGSWMALPYRGVDQVLIPSFISDGGGGKGKTAGNDMFLMTTGMLASGVRTVGISRWSTMGKSTLDLSTEFIKQSKTQDPVTAWHETIKKTPEIKIDLTKEPRFKPSSKNKNAALTAEHPLFWSGMIIVDLPAERPKDVDKDDPDQDKNDADADADADAEKAEAGEGQEKPDDGDADAGKVEDDKAATEEGDGDKSPEKEEDDKDAKKNESGGVSPPLNDPGQSGG